MKVLFLIALLVSMPVMAQTFEASPEELEAAREKMLDMDHAKAVEAVEQVDVSTISCHLSTTFEGRIDNETVDQVTVIVKSDQPSFAALFAAVKSAALEWGSDAAADLEALGFTTKPKE